MTLPEISDVNVLIPNRWGGVDVCSLDDLVVRLASGDYTDLDEVISDASFDSSEVSPLDRLIPRVRELNITGDSQKYWATEHVGEGQ